LRALIAVALTVSFSFRRLHRFLSFLPMSLQNLALLLSLQFFRVRSEVALKYPQL